MRIQLAGVAKHYGAQSILEDVSLSVTPESRLGVVGPNGVGKSTLLRIVGGIEVPDAGSVSRTPSSLTVGYLPQEPDPAGNETLLEYLARRTGVADAAQDLEARAADIASGDPAEDQYAVALERFLALGGGDLEPRARAVCAELGLPVSLDRPLAAHSGGERARAALAVVLLSRFDVLLLDEPTNDLDFDGLARLERFLDARLGGLVVVSHDRAFLDRTVTRIAEIDARSHRVREWAGTFSDYEASREAARQEAYVRFEEAEERRSEVAALLARRRNEARAGGALTHRRGTHALQTKVRRARRVLERVERPEKPFEPWELRLRLEPGDRPSGVVAALDRGVALRGSFRLGPIDLELAAGERVSIAGRNGTGKSTLLGMLLGEIPLESGRRRIGRRTVIGTLEQTREAYGGDIELVRTFADSSALPPEEARTLLAKFGLGAGHVGRPCASLSPGERTRAQLAELQAQRVNVLVLDEPTNHLDLEAIEELERALSSFEGTLVVVSHDRCFLERVEPSRTIEL